jgi:hypothetical protein
MPFLRKLQTGPDASAFAYDSHHPYLLEDRYRVDNGAVFSKTDSI